MLVVTKSLCGFVSNQVQYNMVSAQYLGESYDIIIIIYIRYIYLILWKGSQSKFHGIKYIYLIYIYHIYIYIYIYRERESLYIYIYRC